MRTFWIALRRFFHRPEGAAAIVWALIAMLVVLAALTGLTIIGQRTAGEPPAGADPSPAERWSPASR